MEREVTEMINAIGYSYYVRSGDQEYVEIDGVGLVEKEVWLRQREQWKKNEE